MGSQTAATSLLPHAGIVPPMSMVACNGVALHCERLGHEDGPRLPFCNGSGTTVSSSRPPAAWPEIAAFLGT
jgi:hypothetical protein